MIEHTSSRDIYPNINICSFFGVVRASCDQNSLCVDATSSPDVEVLDVNILVGRGLPLAPQQEALFGRRLCGGREETMVKAEVRRVGACTTGGASQNILPKLSASF